MARVNVQTEIDRSTADVWADLVDITSHVDWMADAVAIRFTSETTQGVGTTFECDTAIGPFRLTDVMEVTAWIPERRMGVRHVGVVTGSGDFTMFPLDTDRTRFEWEETLDFPWYLGGPIGEFVGQYVLSWIWRGNLRRLKARIENSVDPANSQSDPGERATTTG